MKTIEIRRDGIRRSIPADAQIPGLDELAAEHATVLELLKADEAKLEEATAAWRQAGSDHVADLAARMRKSPGAKPKQRDGVEEAERRMQEIGDTVAARTRVLHGIEDEIISLLGAKAPDWLTELDTRIAGELEQWRKNVAGLQGDAAALVDDWARREWVRAVANDGEGRVKSGDLLVHGLRRPDGTPYPLREVLAALEHVGEPPARPEQVTLQEAAERGADKRREAQERLRKTEPAAA